MHKIQNMSAKTCLEECDTAKWVFAERSCNMAGCCIKWCNAPEVIDPVATVHRIADRSPLQKITGRDFLVLAGAGSMVIARFPKRMYMDGCGDGFSLILCQI